MESGGATIEIPRVEEPGSGLGGAWRVIVLNDDHNTFDGVAAALARTIPGVTLDRGHQIATRSTTRARRSSGPARRSRPSTTGSSSRTRASPWPRWSRARALGLRAAS